MNCSRCGTCCKNSYLTFSKAEMDRIIRIHRLDRKTILQSLVDYGYTFVSWNGCVFLGDDGLCSIYDERPITCRMFPFIIDDGGRLRIDTECDNYKTVTIDDFNKAKGLFIELQAKTKDTMRKYTKNHSIPIFQQRSRRFLADLAKFDETHEDFCEWLDAEMYFSGKVQ